MIKKEEIEALRDKYHLPESYFLCVGRLEERKNQHLAIQAMMHCKDKNLVIVGKKTTYFYELKKLIAELNLENRVKIICDVPFEEIPIFLKAADALLYLSKFEGFGIPILEAYNQSVPVVVLETAIAREVAGEAGVFLEKECPIILSELLLEGVYRDTHAISSRVRYFEKKIAEFDLKKLYK